MADNPVIDGQTPKQRYMRRKAMLWSERATWLRDWLDLVDYVAPNAGRFTTTDANKGDKAQRSRKLNDNTAKRAQNVSAAGLQAGMTSPARPWFRLSTGDLVLDDAYEVKLWMRAVEDKMRAVFSASNTYRALHQLYGELLAFGTGVVILEDNYENVLHLTNLTIGEYALATDENGKVNALVREFKMTVGQLVDKFGFDACSTPVQDQYKRGNLDGWIEVHHIVEPRTARDTTKMDAKNKAFMSVYYEVGGGAGNDKLLRDSGFNSFPVLAPRWAVTGNDVYGTGPGHDALPDIRQLQHGQLRKAQAIDYQTNPPLQVPSSIKDAGLNRLPGGVTYVDSVGTDSAIHTMFDVTLDLTALREDIGDMRARIKEHFYEDLFLMMANDKRNGITATEVAELHEEKMLMLGPVLERMQNELFDQLIDFAFDRLMLNGALPPPPPALDRMHLQVQYVGLLAQAQRAVALRSIDRLVATTASLATATQDPGVWDTLDTDEIVDEYISGLGVSPTLMRSKEMVASIRDARVKAAQAQQAAAAAESAANTAQTASQVDPAQLQDVMGMFQGYGSPTAMEVGATL